MAEEDKKKKRKKIMLSGGGSGGPVTPLLEITKELRRSYDNLDFVFVGTETGPEKEMVASFDNLPFISLPSGKLRRYFSIKNFSDIFRIISAFFKSFPLIRRERPDIIISVGSFASVPLVYAACLLRVPVLIHQQDVRPGLANRLMAPVAKIITAVFEKTLADYGPKAILTGNPITSYDKNFEFDKALDPFFAGDKPLLFVLGGGTGAVFINSLIAESKKELLQFCHIIHVTGKNKGVLLHNDNDEKGLYLSWEFLSHQKLLAIMEKSTLLISRCGLATLTEISALSKPSILIPMPKSHQEDNAEIFGKANSALVLHQKDLDSKKFVEVTKELIYDKQKLETFSKNVYNIMDKNASKKIADIIMDIIKDEK